MSGWAGWATPRYSFARRLTMEMSPPSSRNGLSMSTTLNRAPALLVMSARPRMVELMAVPVLPVGADAGVICPWTIYLMYGDTRILKQHLPNMTRWVEWCREHSTNLIRDHDLGGNYGDWLSQGENTQKDLIGTAYFAYSTSLLAKSYLATGDMALAEKISAAFRADQVGVQSALCRERRSHSRRHSGGLLHGVEIQPAARRRNAPRQPNTLLTMCPPTKTT